MVAHDLENPLASLMNWAEILDEQLDDLTEDASPARGSLVKIYRSADQMQQLIHDLLLLTQASSGALDLVHVSLDEAVDVAAREATDLATGIKPRIEHGPLGDVRADLTLVRQVLNNLIGNAVKYVAPGVQPVVQITSHRTGDQMQVQVTDNGIGIPAAERAKVFDSWFRSENARYTYPGTGLGLSITARAIERHGGTITSREGPDGRGSVFTFTLPVDPEPHLRIAHVTAGRRSGRRPHPGGRPAPAAYRLRLRRQLSGFARRACGYADRMSASPDAPPPPGGPQRDDTADTGLHSQDVGVDEKSSQSQEDEHGGTIPIGDEESHPDPGREESSLQRENAETSAQQPSEG